MQTCLVSRMGSIKVFGKAEKFRWLQAWWRRVHEEKNVCIKYTGLHIQILYKYMGTLFAFLYAY